MAYIKQSIITAQDIIESPLGKVVLDFEIGKCPAYYLRELLSTDQLRMLQFIRREEAPERWDAVFDPAHPKWQLGNRASHWAVGYGSLTIAEQRVRVRSLHLGVCSIDLVEVLEHLLCVVDPEDEQLSPLQLAVVGLNGGAVLKMWRYSEYGLDGLDLPGFTKAGGNVEMIRSVVFLGFATLEALHHAAWLLKVGGAKIGRVGILGAVGAN